MYKVSTMQWDSGELLYLKASVIISVEVILK